MEHKKLKFLGEIFLLLSVVLGAVSCAVIFWLSGNLTPFVNIFSLEMKPYSFELLLLESDVKNLNFIQADTAIQSVIAYLEEQNLTQGLIWSRIPSWGNLESRYRSIQKLALNTKVLRAVFPDLTSTQYLPEETKKDLRKFLGKIQSIEGNYVYKHIFFNRYPGWTFAFYASLFGVVFVIIRSSKEGN